MHTIFFTSFYGFIPRNLFSTDVLGVIRKRSDVRVVIFVPFYKQQHFEEHYSGPNVVIEGVNTGIVVNSRRNTFFASLFLMLLRSFTLDYRQKERLSRNRTPGGYLSYALSRAVTLIGGRSRLVHTIARWAERTICPKDAFAAYFDTYQPQIVFASDVFQDIDAALLREAQARGVATIGMVRSWDNNTTRGLCRVLPGLAIVNNPIIRNELIELQHMPADRIEVVGVPQFDRYVRGPRASREAFCARIGADPAKRLVLFAPAGDQLSDTDEQILDCFRAAADRGALPAGLQFLVRMHPGCPASIERYGADPLFRIERPGVQFAERVKDTELAPADAEHLGDSLFHSEVVIHVSSSLGLDAVMFDKPQIMIEFDGRTEKPYLFSVRRYHDEDHMRRFIDTGAAAIATGEAELLTLLRRYLDDPSADAEGRRRGREQQAWRLDGQAGAALAAVVLGRLTGSPDPL